MRHMEELLTATRDSLSGIIAPGLLVATMLVASPALARDDETIDFGDVVIGHSYPIIRGDTMHTEIFGGSCPSFSNHKRYCGFRISLDDPPDAARICSALTNPVFALPYGCAWNLRPDEHQDFAVSCTPSSTETYTATLYAYVVRDEKIQYQWKYLLSCRGVLSPGPNTHPPADAMTLPPTGAAALPAALLLFME
jgi:hypothetical protein